MKKFGLVLFLLVRCAAQDSKAAAASKTQTRTFSQPVAAVQAGIANLRGETSGKLPTLEGFAVPAAHALETYRRPYYECTVRVTASPAQGSEVRVSAKITAWYNGPDHPGYEVLASNGRLESDLLDRLSETLASKPQPNASKKSPAAAPEISAPMPQFPKGSAFPKQPPTQDSGVSALATEATNLEEILRNQAHPENLVAVKQDQTPVLDNPRTDAKVLFLASAEDEFEILETNPEWVHVRISGLSRGWLRRSAIDQLGESQNAEVEGTGAKQYSGDAQRRLNEPVSLFSVTSEEDGAFPGDWQVLKGKTVKIVSVQQSPGSGRITSPAEKIHYAESLFKKQQLPNGAEGLVLIFDSEDGGMIASTRALLEGWKRGAISENAFWKQCFLDPPEILGQIN